MQQRNIIVFIVLALAIILGWSVLQRQIWPKADLKDSAKKQAEPAKELPPAEQRAAAATQVLAAPAVGLPGLAEVLGMAGELAVLDKTFLPIRIEPALALLSPAQRAALGPVSLAGLTTAFPPAVAGWLMAANLTPVAKVAPPTPTGKLQTIALGGPDYYLRAVLTTRGAGVQALTLTRFQAADREGRPVYLEKDGQRDPAPLKLIQDDPYYPSFALYHYPDPGKLGEEPPAPATTLGEAFWKLEKKTDNGQEQEVHFSTGVPGYDHFRLVKIYTLKAKDYHIGLTLEIQDTREGEGPPRAFRYQLAGPHGLPIEGFWYTYTYRNAVIGMVDARDNLWRTLEDSRHISHWEGGPRVPEASRGSDALQYAVVQNQYFASGIVVDNQQPSADQGGVKARDILAWARPMLETREVRGKVIRLDLKANEVTVLDVVSKGPVTCRLLPRARAQFLNLNLKEADEVFLTAYEVGRVLYAGAVYEGEGSRPFLDDITVRVNSELIELKPGETRAHRFMLYNGPVKVALLAQFGGDREVDPDLVTRYADTLHLSTLTDYRSAGWFGTVSQTIHLTDLFIACTRLMHWLLYYLMLIVRNEGLAIILMTVLVRAALFPISRRQALMSQKMQALAPELKKMQEKYKNDPQARTAAMMELYRKHGVNPLGGCLPLFLQMPIFLGLYWSLQESIRFRLAPFLWIDNLAAPDMLIRWGNSIPYVSDPNNLGGFLYLGPYFNVLPVVAVVLMLAVQKMMMPPATDDQQVMQQKMMKWMMILMGVFFYKVAAGLCLYFIASSLWGLAERKLLPRRQTALAGVPVGTAGPGAKGGGRGPSGRSRGKGKKPAEDTRFQKVRDWWQEVLKQAKKK